MAITVSDGVLNILNVFYQNGFEAYIVGGAVRDSVMEKTPHDYDIATNALPQQVKKLFSRTIDTGISHGTVTVIDNNVGYEVTTYRSEDNYSDSRHPDKISFVSNICEDLKRRDFTINAMCYSPKDGVCDYFGGLPDIAARLIRTVGNPIERFSEDALRMLRAVRFSVVLGFEIESETAAAIKKCAPLILKISKERILGELNKIILSEHPERITKLYELGLLHYIIPELEKCFSTPQKNKYHIYNVGEHIVNATAYSENDLILRWATLLHDIGKPQCSSTDSNGVIHFYGHHYISSKLANEILHRLRMDSDSIREITLLIENHDIRIEPSPPAVKKILAKLGDNLFIKLLKLQAADNKAKSQLYIDEKLKRIDDIYSVYQNIIAEGHPYLLSHLQVNGRDLIKLGFKAGREIGDVLKILLNEVMIRPELNRREYLLKRAKELHRRKAR